MRPGTRLAHACLPGPGGLCSTTTPLATPASLLCMPTHTYAGANTHTAIYCSIVTKWCWSYGSRQSKSNANLWPWPHSLISTPFVFFPTVLLNEGGRCTTGRGDASSQTRVSGRGTERPPRPRTTPPPAAREGAGAGRVGRRTVAGRGGGCGTHGGGDPELHPVHQPVEVRHDVPEHLRPRKPHPRALDPTANTTITLHGASAAEWHSKKGVPPQKICPFRGVLLGENPTGASLWALEPRFQCPQLVQPVSNEGGDNTCGVSQPHPCAGRRLVTVGQPGFPTVGGDGAHLPTKHRLAAERVRPKPHVEGVVRPAKGVNGVRVGGKERNPPSHHFFLLGFVFGRGPRSIPGSAPLTGPGVLSRRPSTDEGYQQKLHV